MKNDNYIPRIIDEEIKKYLAAFGSVCIEGPKLCGKTSTGFFHSKSYYFVADPSGNFQNRKFAEMAPLSILEGVCPRLIDEWQEVPSIWDAVRVFVDESQKKGLIILSGSINPKRKGVFHSGTGRIARLRISEGVR